MSKSKENPNEKSIKLSRNQNIILIISSIVILAMTMYALVQPLYMMIAPLLLAVLVFCLIPLLKSNATYSKPYMRAHGFLVIVAVLALGYFIIQLIKDQMSIQCIGLMGSRISCVEGMQLSLWGISFFVSATAGILCGYGVYTQLRLPK